jgi:four helix bundle protein
MALRILDDIVAMVARVHGLARKIARFDRDLARQITRASASVGLNAGEGLAGRGGTRTVRLNDAMCSGRETIMALRIAGACGYLDGGVVAAEVDTIDRVVATLYKLAR